MKRLSRREKEKIKAYFEQHPQVMVVYLFGSQCQKGVKRPRDIDLAILLKEEISLRQLLRFKLEVSRRIEVANVDIVVLDNASPLLKYEIVSSGEVILVKDEQAQWEFESEVYLHFFDTHYLRKVQDSYLLRLWSDGT